MKEKYNDCPLSFLQREYVIDPAYLVMEYTRNLIKYI